MATITRNIRWNANNPLAKEAFKKRLKKDPNAVFGENETDIALRKQKEAFDLEDKKSLATSQRDASRLKQKSKSRASSGRASTILSDLFSQLATSIGDQKTLLGL